MALAAPWAAQAQGTAAPSTEDIIQQLRPAGRTRGLRNLTVEQVPAAPGSDAAAAVVPPAPQQPEAAAAAPAPATALAQAERPSVSLLIQFGFDSAQVQPESTQALRNLAAALRSPDLSGSSFSIEGHTDAKGNPAYNLKLSQRRADAVRELLTRFGVEGARLVSVGKGASEPANPQDPFDALNRRVRVVNLE